MTAGSSVSKYAKPIIVGFIVAFVVGGGLGFLASAGGADPGMTPGLVGMICGTFTAYIMANLAGNRKGKAASDADKASAVAFRPEPGKALLLVFREGFVGKAAGMNVGVDGRVVAQLKSPRFTAIPLDVGSHEMELAFGGLAAEQNRANVERFGVGAGEVVAYQAKISMGALKNTIQVTRVTPDAGLSAKLAAMPMTALEA